MFYVFLNKCRNILLFYIIYNSLFNQKNFQNMISQIQNEVTKVQNVGSNPVNHKLYCYPILLYYYSIILYI